VPTETASAPAAGGLAAALPPAQPASAPSAAVQPAATPPAAVQPAATPPAAVQPAQAGDDSGPRRSLSPSRAADFLACPLLYRFRVIDKIPERPSQAAARGTLVHAVLERLFDSPAGSRSPQVAAELLGPQWDRLVEAEPELAELFDDEQERARWLAEAGIMLDRYFELEDPTRLEPAHRELAVQAVLESGLALRGYIDRLDVSPAGEIRIVDYKTGTAPREDFEARALFQMRFYALVLWRSRGTMPRLLQLMYLGNGELVRYCPDEADLAATERKINALWRAIERATLTGDWRPRPGKLCEWCSHQLICPAFGGTPPPLPSVVPEQAGREQASPEQASREQATPEQAVPPARQQVATGAAGASASAAGGQAPASIPPAGLAPASTPPAGEAPASIGATGPPAGPEGVEIPDDRDYAI
jgi:putative RecB family exonuclease